MNDITIDDFFTFYDSNLSKDEKDFILFNMTPYPFLEDTRELSYYIRKGIRQYRNKRKTCECCGYLEPLHHKKCYFNQ